MRTILLMSLIALGFSFAVSQVASAVCVQNGNTPGGGNIINCPAPPQNTELDQTSVPNTTNFPDEVNVPEGGGIINIAVGSAIFTAAGDDIVRTSGDYSVNNGSTISTSNGNDTVIVDGGTINTANASSIFMGNQNDTLIVNAGFLDGGNRAVTMGSEDDKVTINGGTLESNSDSLIATGAGNDMVNLNGGIYLGGSLDVIALEGENDMLTFGGDIDLGGFVDCGDGFDTIVFAMDVPQEAVGFISSQILASNPAGDSILINGITYEWQDCELLVPDLNGVLVVRSIPTLSEWALIAMAGVLGIVGLLAVRRKTVSA